MDIREIRTQAVFHMGKSIPHNQPTQNRVENRGASWRVWVVFGILTICFMVLLFRLYNLQVVAYETYTALADNQHMMFRELKAERGQIYLRDGNQKYPVGVNKSYPLVFVSPREVKDKEGVIGMLSEKLGLDRKEIEPHFSNMSDPFEIIRKKIGDEQAELIKQKKMAGVYITDEMLRFYPSDTLAAHVIGFVGSDGFNYSGKYGIEAFWDDVLSGKNGSIEQIRDPGGRWIPVTEKSFIPASDGADIILTIDQSIQYTIENILRESIEKYNAEGGSIVVMEPKSGKILGMANAPDFHPNAYGSTSDISLFVNGSVSRPYESGSAFKPITMAIGLDTGRILPTTTYEDMGEVNISGYTIKNSDEKSNGTQTMTEVLEKSLNTGTIFVEKSVGNKIFLDYVKNFGFGEKTGTDLPGEVRGNIHNLDNLKRDINFYTASFGQGISVTPIQLASAFCALANGGTLMKPQIVDRIEYSDGREENVKPQEIRKVIQESTARMISDMLEAVVVNGHGKKAAVPGYRVGGKTGTAQVVQEGEKGYHKDYNIGTFVGYAPIQDPKFVVLVKLDNPKNVEWAESSAAPTFGQVMSFLLEHGKIEPTENYTVDKLNRVPKQ